MRAHKTLTVRQRLFVAYFLGEAHGNAAKAASLAGYLDPYGSGHSLLKRPLIQKMIEAKLDKIEMGQMEVLFRLSRLARADAGDFLKLDDGDGPPTLDFAKAARRDQLVNIKKIKSYRRGDEDPLEVVEIEIHSPIDALKAMAKYHGVIDKPVNASDVPDMSKMNEEQLEAIATGKESGVRGD